MKEINLIVGQDINIATVLMMSEAGFVFDINDGKISGVSYGERKAV